ncbi:RcpC/CpaB family pilus assembly protein [Streptomyces sp. NPDC059076]|uniref:RcpC/CpaB family pilus assembly protein n=1 Tax=unclassified Streptomyces TaxID=2593676 RepID=UPI0036B938A0
MSERAVRGGPALPATAVPEPHRIPEFAPLRVQGGAHRLRRALRRRRRQGLAAGLALVATALAVASARGEDGDAGNASAVPPRPRPPASSVEMVSAPVRIADGETVRLLRPGDRLDVIAVPDASAGGRGEQPPARVVAAGVRVTEVPTAADDGTGDGGALVVLSVPRSTAVELAGASAATRLAVTLR